jgi:hypothetical protein
MAVSGSKTNYVTLTATNDVFPATAALQSAVTRGNYGVGGTAPVDYPGVNLAGIVVRKNSGVIGNVRVQVGYFSGTTLAYVDWIPSTTLATNVGFVDFWHMPEGGGGMSPRQIKATLMSNMSIVLVKR